MENITPFVLAADRPPYDRHPKEPSVAWNAFVIYRDLGPGRTFTASQDKYREVYAYTENPWKMRRRWQALADKYLWAERAVEWDRELDASKREAILTSVVRLHEDHRKIAQATFELLVNELKKLIVLSKENPKALLTLPEFLRCLKEIMVLQQTSYQEPSAVTETRVTVRPQEEMRQLLRACLSDEAISEAFIRAAGEPYVTVDS